MSFNLAQSLMRTQCKPTSRSRFHPHRWKSVSCKILSPPYDKRNLKKVLPSLEKLEQVSLLQCNRIPNGEPWLKISKTETRSSAKDEKNSVDVNVKNFTQSSNFPQFRMSSQSQLSTRVFSDRIDTTNFGESYQTRSFHWNVYHGENNSFGGSGGGRGLLVAAGGKGDEVTRCFSSSNNPSEGDKGMSTFLLPIIGSPPEGDISFASSPMDDISAFTGSFRTSGGGGGGKDASSIGDRSPLMNRRFMLRRKLSTSFDDPVLLGGGGGGNRVSNERRASVKEDEEGGKSGGGGGAWMEEHFKKFMGLRISECSEGDGDNASIGSGGGGGGRGSGRGSFSNDLGEDLFELLEKVIGFKGRNVSHITVEQSVKDLCTVYNDTDEWDKLKFFNSLGESYGVDHSGIVSLANNLSTCQDDQMRLNLEEKLRTALIPKYQWLFSQVGRLDNGVKFLVDLRTDILDAIERSTESTTNLKALNYCLKELIGVWFAVGFLKLERITWNSSCEMLQKISEYEAVHPMRNWTDLKKRVGPNRRCFAFTHGSMPNEPVVVLHTALTNHIPSCIHKIVTKRRLMSVEKDNEASIAEEIEDRDFIDTAIFYSITSTQRGLTGIELGNYLIKRVVRELQMEFPKIRQFSSLSPIPGFSKWLLGSLKTAQRDPANQSVFSQSEIETLSPILNERDSSKDFFSLFLDILKLNEWYNDGNLVASLEGPLIRLCGQYLYIVKRRGYAMDPVAHFHLKNGAVLWRLNWLGDASPRGLSQSCGMMVNYRYFLEDCETNSQNYLENQVIQISDGMKSLVQETENKLNSKM